MHRDSAARGTTAWIAGVAGLAITALQGCAFMGGANTDQARTKTGPDQAPAADTADAGPAGAEDDGLSFVRTAGPPPSLNRQPIFGAPPVFPDGSDAARRGSQPAGGTAEGQDGWRFVDATGAAERDPEPLPEPQNPQRGPNMASTLYGQLLGMELPISGDLLAEHTANMRQITFTNDGSVFDPVVSGDGRHLFFSSTQHRPTSDIYVQEVGSRVVTRLTSDRAQDVMPAISPDGTRIAFASNRAGNWDIWVMPATGGKAIQVTTDPGHDLHPSWSPDGQHLVYSRLGQTSGRWEMWVSDVFNNVRTQFIGYGLFPEWSPLPGTGINGGDQILFQRSRERGKRTFAVWTVDFDLSTLQAGNETQIVSNPDAALINPTWSPDGQWITFSAVPNPEKWIGAEDNALPPSAGVWMIGVDGRSELPLTAGDSIDMMPAWSPNGQVFFVSDRNGAENLWAVDIAPALLTARGGNPFNNGVRPSRAAVIQRPSPNAPLTPERYRQQGAPTYRSTQQPRLPYWAQPADQSNPDSRPRTDQAQGPQTTPNAGGPDYPVYGPWQGVPAQNARPSTVVNVPTDNDG